MDELIYEFAEPVQGYAARVWGRGRSDGTWEGWIEFTAPDGARVTTDRETTQSNANDVLYWATGLQTTYLEGALDRAQRR
jgi:hypothetical protein